MLFGNGTVERATKAIFGFETSLTPAPGGGYLLRGTKYYSTGSLYCDRIVVGARLPTPRSSRPSSRSTARA